MKVVVPVGSHKMERKEGKRVFFVILLAIRSHVSCKSHVSAWHRGEGEGVGTRHLVGARLAYGARGIHWPSALARAFLLLHLSPCTDSKRLQAAS